jgi:hypothetical protein
MAKMSVCTVSPSEDQYSQLVPSLKTISEMIVAELADCADAIKSGFQADGGALRIGFVNRDNRRTVERLLEESPSTNDDPQITVSPKELVS